MQPENDPKLFQGIQKQQSKELKSLCLSWNPDFDLIVMLQSERDPVSISLLKMITALYFTQTCQRCVKMKWKLAKDVQTFSFVLMFV